MMHKLKEVRFYKRVTQPLLALKTDIQQSRLSLIENELVRPRKEEMEKIAQALGVQVQDIFPHKEQNNEE
jgi:DNA-binding XRE family transcriptional regulator